MKTLIKALIILFLAFGVFGSTYADNHSNEEGGITITVTEKVPGAGCYPINKKGNKVAEDSDKATGKYKCEIKKGFGSVVTIMGNIIKYFTFIVLLAAVLFLVIGGIMYSMGGADPSIKDKAKEKIIGGIVGIIILLLSGVILNAVAPWIYK